MKVLFFASLKEQLDCGELDLDSSGLGTIRDVLNHLLSQGEPWSSALASANLLVALNQEIAHLDDTVSPNDELAFFPPVTGG